MEIFIEENKWDDVVNIYLRERNGDRITAIHSLCNGIAQGDTQENGCAFIKIPYIKMPAAVWKAIEKELFRDNEIKLNDEIKKLKGELMAKEKHIENLNEIFDKTLNKI